MAAQARVLQAALLGACLFASGLSPAAVRAETPDPAPQMGRAELIETALGLEAELAALLEILDAEIARQEETAGFGASEESLAQIDGLIARRAAFAAKHAELQALLVTLQRTE